MTHFQAGLLLPQTIFKLGLRAESAANTCPFGGDHQCTKLCSFVSKNLYFYRHKRDIQIAYNNYLSLYEQRPNLTVHKIYK